MNLTPLVSPTLWCLTVGAGVGKVTLKKQVAVSRFCDLTAIGSVGTDFAIQFFRDHDLAKLSAVLTLGVAFGRTALIMAHDFSARAQRNIAITSFRASAALVVGGQLFLNHGVDWRTSLLLLSSWFGAYMESKVGRKDSEESMITRRRYFMLAGLSSCAFGALTLNLSFFTKNLTANVIGTAIEMYRQKDPLPRLPKLDLDHPYTQMKNISRVALHFGY